MKAQMPPIFWAFARTWYSSVVLPDDSGPNTSTMRPRGRPPTPRARSSESAPVGTAATRTAAASSPIFMIDPWPNCRSIWPSAFFSADSRAWAAFCCSLSIRSLSSRKLSESTNVSPGSDRPRPPRWTDLAPAPAMWLDRPDMYEHRRANPLRRIVRVTAAWPPVSWFYARTLHHIDRLVYRGTHGRPTFASWVSGL